jgi:hypothetical protein
MFKISYTSNFETGDIFGFSYIIGFIGKNVVREPLWKNSQFASRSKVYEYRKFVSEK